MAPVRGMVRGRRPEPKTKLLHGISAKSDSRQYLKRKEKTLSIGTYPVISLSQAREMAHEMHAQDTLQVRAQGPRTISRSIRP